jgi:hypothetical protein
MFSHLGLSVIGSGLIELLSQSEDDLIVLDRQGLLAPLSIPEVGVLHGGLGLGSQSPIDQANTFSEKIIQLVNCELHSLKVFFHGFWFFQELQFSRLTALGLTNSLEVFIVVLR